jgi:hypothetical protein
LPSGLAAEQLGLRHRLIIFTPLSSWVDVKKVAVGYVGFPVLAVGYVGFRALAVGYVGFRALAVGYVGFRALAVGYVGFRASTQPTVLLPTLYFYMN